MDCPRNNCDGQELFIMDWYDDEEKQAYEEYQCQTCGYTWSEAVESTESNEM